MTEIALDTHVVAYAEGLGDAARVEAAGRMLEDLAGRIVLCTQVLGEFYDVMVRKAGRSPSDALTTVELWQHYGRIVETSSTVFGRGLSLAAAGRLRIRDALILATAEEAGCDIMLSDDMQHGFEWRRITVVNPFVEPPHPLLRAALKARL